VADYYRDLAADYDWLYADDALTGGFAIAPGVAWIRSTSPTSCSSFRTATGSSRTSTGIPLLPVTLGELRERLELAGLREVGTDFGEATDQYVVIAVAA
jgi:hypothetical protein